jgi:hypothetical protein
VVAVVVAEGFHLLLLLLILLLALRWRLFTNRTDTPAPELERFEIVVKEYIALAG